MNIAELFVNLGVKGNDKTLGALTSVTGGLGKAKSMSIEAKAGILGAVYALEQLMVTSDALGTRLTNFAALTGLSTTELQRWEYATIQAGGSASELDSAVQGIQKSMAMIDLNKGLPEGLALLSQAAGGIDFSKKDDPFYMMKAFEKGIKNLGDSPKAKAVANYLAGTLGISDNIIAGMRRGKYDPSILARAPIISPGELGQLDKANIGWKNLFLQVERAFDHFNAKHGLSLVTDLGKITVAVTKLAEALAHLAEVTNVFGVLDNVLTTTAHTIGAVSGDKKDQSWFTNLYSQLQRIQPYLSQGSVPGLPDFSKSILPTVQGGKSSTPNNVDIKQTVIFQGQNDAPKKTADSLHKAAADFVKQNPAKVQGS